MKVFQHTARYDSVIAGYLEQQVQSGDVKFPKVLSLQFDRAEILRYGENPHQQGAFYRERQSTEPSVSRGTILHGKAMSYNNFLDANSALELAKEYDEIGGRDHQAQQSLRSGARCYASRRLCEGARDRSRLGVRRRDRVQSPGGSGRGERNHLDVR